jgi:hypothetical protein
MTELNESEIRKMPFFVTWHTMFLSIYSTDLTGSNFFFFNFMDELRLFIAKNRFLRKEKPTVCRLLSS